MDKFTSMSTFIKVAELGSFAEAARQIGQSRSQINRLVINLEDELGITLLNRTTRSVTLTPTGNAYLQRAKSILNDLAETESLIQSNQEKPKGEIKINAPMSFGTLHFTHAIITFMQEYPDIRIELLLNDQMVDPVSNGFDMTVRIAEPLNSLALIEHPIIDIQRILCASPDFVKNNDELTNIEKLKNLPCLHYGNLPSENNWKLVGPEGEKTIRVNGILCSNNAEVLCDAAAANMGIALLPTFIAHQALSSGKLVPVFSNYRATPIKLSLVYPPNRHLSARIRLFVEFMQNRFANEPF
ncbi:MAG: LysR family transcriptional regulator [Rickettsiales bacterium]|nr:LysR family transcriptional regulator [Rickettsiales bacterium]